MTNSLSAKGTGSAQRCFAPVERHARKAFARIAKGTGSAQRCFAPVVQHARTPFARGFTMVEMVIVIVIVGILSAVAMSRFVDSGNFDAPAYAGKVRSLLRYGQKLAVAQNRPVYASVGAGAVSLCFDAGCAAPVPAPSGANSGGSATLAACAGSATWYCEGRPQSVPMSASVALPFTFFFDEQGRPFNGTDATGSDNSTFTGLALAIGSGGGAQSVNVERETGYVH